MFDEKLDEIDRMLYGPEKEAAVKAAAVELSSLVASTLTREKLKDRFTKVLSISLLIEDCS